MNWPNNWLVQMLQVNSEVNRLPYVGDATKYDKPDFWKSIDEAGAGDCEDFAIAKLRRLRAAGWPIEALRLACCYVETDEYHAVLVVDAPEGAAFMLDNRQADPIPVASLPLIGYRPDRIQAIGGAQEWREWLL
jgi:predicted transglutaminase-like cysteine proteinase